MTGESRWVARAMAAHAVLCLVSMATMSIGAGLVSASLLADSGGPRRLWNELRGLWREHAAFRGYVRVSAALALACLLSLAGARGFPLVFGGKAVQVDWLRDTGKLWYFLLPPFYAVAWRRMGQEQRKRALQCWLGCFGILSWVGVFQFFTGFPRAEQNFLLPPGHYLTFLFFGHHLSTASIWIFPFFAALDALRESMRARRGKPRKEDAGSPPAAALPLPLGWLAFFLPAALFTLFFTYSRTLWAALPIGLAGWVLLSMRSRRAAAPVVAGIALMMLALSQTPWVQSRFHNMTGVFDRVDLWKANLEFFKARPFFGVGFRKNQELYAYYHQWLAPSQTDFFIGHAHDIYLELLSGMGLAGLLAWLAWVARAVRFGLPARSASSGTGLFEFRIGLLCAWGVLLLNGVTQVNFWEGKVLHQIMWMAGMSLYWALAKANVDKTSQLM